MHVWQWYGSGAVRRSRVPIPCCAYIPCGLSRVAISCGYPVRPHPVAIPWLCISGGRACVSAFVRHRLRVKWKLGAGFVLMTVAVLLKAFDVSPAPASRSHTLRLEPSPSASAPTPTLDSSSAPNLLQRFRSRDVSRPPHTHTLPRTTAYLLRVDRSHRVELPQSPHPQYAHAARTAPAVKSIPHSPHSHSPHHTAHAPIQPAHTCTGKPTQPSRPTYDDARAVWRRLLWRICTGHGAPAGADAGRAPRPTQRPRAPSGPVHASVHRPAGAR
mmetsp:Transcript_30070/g.74069  ORF Transcript_30070/g.74069 Transcript_30070/m.74069 type:complete len:272 (+) Transcript_30070:84-899(+)